MYNDKYKLHAINNFVKIQFKRIKNLNYMNDCV